MNYKPNKKIIWDWKALSQNPNIITNNDIKYAFIKRKPIRSQEIISETIPNEHFEKNLNKDLGFIEEVPDKE